jgi:hypothetical protein
MSQPEEIRHLYTRRIVLGITLSCLLVSWGWSAQQLPARLTDEAFWKLVTDLSEPGGSFVSDNFLSNERLYQHVLSDLTHDRGSGAYLGVGPEQNFTYIAALKPDIAFIFDIRRQNMIEHLMYKALFELSADRAEFLSRLFSRPRPADLSKDADVVTLFTAFGEVEADYASYEKNLQAIKDRLLKDHGFTLTTDDESNLEYVFRAFYMGGPALRYSRTSPPGLMPSYEELMTETDEQGVYRSYLATEENFQAVRRFEINNLLVPLVGDFAGPTAIRAVGQYLKDHNSTVTAFYTSNVEQYLFQNAESWKKFYMNVSTLPLRSRSVFIRAMVRTASGELSPLPLVRSGFSRLESALFPIADLLAAFKSEAIQSYSDIVQLPLDAEPVKN